MFGCKPRLKKQFGHKRKKDEIATEFDGQSSYILYATEYKDDHYEQKYFDRHQTFEIFFDSNTE